MRGESRRIGATVRSLSCMFMLSGAEHCTIVNTVSNAIIARKAISVVLFPED